jgi:putative FmdB family regulatory protein
MPVYTYECTNCGVRFDRQQKYNERNLTRCPECGKNEIHRVYRPVGVVFKGSGFYVTDNRSASASRLGAATDSKEEKSDKTEKTEKAEKPEKSEPVEKATKKESKAEPTAKTTD